MTTLYHAAAFAQRSGIARYAIDFHDLVLQPRGYVRLDLDAPDSVSAAELLVGERDTVHVEVGVNQHAEIDLLYRLLARGTSRVDVTLHDPPFVRWPHFRFRGRLLNNASKFVHLYLRNFGIGTAELRRIRRFFVLTREGAAAVRRRYPFADTRVLPFVLRESSIFEAQPSPANLLFFGFIAANKGLDYALALHEEVLRTLPETRFFVVGDAIDPVGASYLDGLKQRYRRNVIYCGFVEESQLAARFAEASIVVLPFQPYKSVIPASASVLGAMAKGKAVAATDVNAVREFIRPGETGYMLARRPSDDARMLVRALGDPAGTLAVAERAVAYLRSFHNPRAVGLAFDSAERPP